MSRAIAVLFVSFLALNSAHGQLIRSASGANASSITAARDQFRADLGGGTVPGANGSFGGVRREINWDGVPDGFSSPNALPANFFNANSPRGAAFSTPGSGFQVSSTAASGTPVNFGNIDPSYTATFGAFTAERLFTPIGSNVMNVNFFLPGTNTPALTTGFGAVFTDVDLANTTSIQLFNSANVSLGTFFVPATVGSQTFSFFGVSFATPIIASVRITLGNAVLAPGVTDQNGASRDLVAMDDFIYGEPVPEPATVVMLLVGGLPLVALLRKRLARQAP
jgi:hypothetical protein